MQQVVPRYASLMPGMMPGMVMGQRAPYLGAPYLAGSYQGMGFAFLIPLIGLAISAAGSAARSMIAKNQASGAQKVNATTVVNNVELHMRQNLDAWNSSLTKYLSEQAAALDTYDRLWNYLTSPSGCGNMTLGQAGQYCISERSPGGKWDYRAYYRDPIANDIGIKADPGSGLSVQVDPVTGKPVVVQDASNSAVGTVDALASGTVAGVPIMLLAAAGLLVAVMMGGSK